MKSIRIAFKIFGILILTRTILAFVNLLTLFFYNSPQRSENILMQSSLVIVNLLFALLFIRTPGWLVGVFNSEADDFQFMQMKASILLRIGVILLGVYLLSINMIKVITYIIEYAIVFNGNDEFLKRSIRKEALKQISSIVSMIAGYLIIRFENTIGKIMKDEENLKT